MFRKFLAVVAVATLIVSASALALDGSALLAQSQAQAQPQAQQPRLRSVSGKITSVSGQTFVIEVGQGENKQTLEFATNSSTVKSGDLKVGSTAMVQYQPGAGGQNTATKVEIQ